MTFFMRIIFSLTLAILLVSGTTFAKDKNANDALAINDIAGKWRIEVIDRPDSTFKGSALIPNAKGYSVIAETITEDKCCNGRNHARVLQDSLITISDGQIDVESTIVKYLLREEEVHLTYYADDFSLRQLDHNTLVGTANGSLRVRWVRHEDFVS